MFNGSLLGSGGDTFPLSYIYKETYKVSRKIMDLDSFRNANGVLERNVLDHTSCVITFDTKPMSNIHFAEMMDWFRRHYSLPRERKISITYYDFEYDNYFTGWFYMADPEIPVHHVWGNKLLTLQTQIKLVEY